MKDWEHALKTMSVHETIQLPDGTEVLRVLGGWVYTLHSIDQYNVHLGLSACFVPESIMRQENED